MDCVSIAPSTGISSERLDILITSHSGPPAALLQSCADAGTSSLGTSAERCLCHGACPVDANGPNVHGSRQGTPRELPYTALERPRNRSPAYLASGRFQTGSCARAESGRRHCQHAHLPDQNQVHQRRAPRTDQGGTVRARHPGRSHHSRRMVSQTGESSGSRTGFGRSHPGNHDGCLSGA